jgi:hypothetical protein
MGALINQEKKIDPGASKLHLARLMASAKNGRITYDGTIFKVFRVVGTRAIFLGQRKHIDDLFNLVKKIFGS